MTALSLENFFWCSFKVSAALGDLAPKDFAKTRFYQERETGFVLNTNPTK